MCKLKRVTKHKSETQNLKKINLVTFKPVFRAMKQFHNQWHTLIKKINGVWPGNKGFYISHDDERCGIKNILKQCNLKHY